MPIARNDALDQVKQQIRSEIAAYETRVAKAEENVQAARERLATLRSELEAARTSLAFLSRDESKPAARVAMVPIAQIEAAAQANGAGREQTIDAAIRQLERFEKAGMTSPASYGDIAREAIHRGFKTGADKPEYNFFSALSRELRKPHPRVKKVGKRWALPHWKTEESSEMEA